MPPPEVDGGVVPPPDVEGGVVPPPEVDGGVVPPPEVDGGVVPPPEVEGGVVPPPDVEGGAQLLSASTATGVQGKTRLVAWATSARIDDLPPGVNDRTNALVAVRLSTRLITSASFNQPFAVSCPSLSQSL